MMMRNNIEFSKLWLAAMVTDEIWANGIGDPSYVSTRISSTSTTTNVLASLADLPISIHTNRIPLIQLINTDPNPSCDPGKSHFTLVKSTILPENEVNFPNRHIPKIIHMTSKTRCMTPSLLENIDKWRFQGYALYFHDDAAVDRLLEKHWPEFPHLQLMLSCSISRTIRTNIWRLLVLWEYGGIYADVDSAPAFLFQNASAIKDGDEAWFVVDNLGIMSQYFMASAPKHPFFHTAILACLDYLSKAASIDSSEVPFVTGPGTIKEAMRFFMKATEAAQFEIVTNGTYAGIGGRRVTVVGSSSGTEQWIKREAVNTTKTEQFSGETFNATNTSCYEQLHRTIIQLETSSSEYPTSSAAYNSKERRKPSTDSLEDPRVPAVRDLIPLIDLVNTGPEPRCNASGLIPFPNTVLNESTTHPPGRQIPKIIHMTGRIRCVPERLKQNLDKWRFDGYSIYFHDDAAVDRLLAKYFPTFPHLQLLSHCAFSGAGKADLWRYLALWEYGGIYTDIDNAPGFKFENASAIQDTDEAWFVVERIGVLSQYFMASSPKHPIMFIAMMECLSRLLVLVDKIGTQYVPFVTGPGVTKSAMVRFTGDTKHAYPIEGIYTGVGGSKVTVVGTRKTSQDWIVRDSIKAKHLLYIDMKMNHWSKQKNQTLTDSCFEYLYKLSD